mgnify:CR=1 FL=1
MSINQMVKQNQAKQEAESAGQAAVARARGITEQNKLAALEVPTKGLALAKEQQARREASAIPLLQQDARSALGGVSNLAQAGIEEDLGLAAQADALKYERDAKVLTEDAAIEKRRMERELAIEEAEIAGAGLAARDAQEAFNVAAGSAIALGGDVAAESMKYKEWKADPSKPFGYTGKDD